MTGLDATITGIQLPGMTRFRPWLLAAWWVLAVVVLLVAVRLTRYETMKVGEVPLVLDRWRHEFCTVRADTQRACFPVR